MMEKLDRFDLGYACACACIVQGHGANTPVEDALKANGFTSLRKLRESGVAEHDVGILRDVVNKIEKEEL